MNEKTFPVAYRGIQICPSSFSATGGGGVPYFGTLDRAMGFVRPPRLRLDGKIAVQAMILELQVPAVAVNYVAPSRVDRPPDEAAFSKVVVLDQTVLINRIGLVVGWDSKTRDPILWWRSYAEVFDDLGRVRIETDFCTVAEGIWRIDDAPHADQGDAR